MSAQFEFDWFIYVEISQFVRPKPRAKILSMRLAIHPQKVRVLLL